MPSRTTCHTQVPEKANDMYVGLTEMNTCAKCARQTTIQLESITSEIKQLFLSLQMFQSTTVIASTPKSESNNIAVLGWNYVEAVDFIPTI